MPPVSGHELLDRLHTLMHRVKGRMHRAARDESDRLAPMEARALAYFARHPGSSQSALVLHAGRDKAQIARIVKLLVERGLLQAEPDPQDRRSLRLDVTEAGRAMQRRMHRQRVQIEAELLDVLSEAQRRQLLALLDRVLAALPAEPP